MESAKKKFIIGGNWKCNGTMNSINELISGVLNTMEFNNEQVEVVVAPISIHIASVKALLNAKIKVACQNMSDTGNGAFTGEISAEQLRDFDVDWVLIGHSERRTLYNESNELVASKIKKA